MRIAAWATAAVLLPATLVGQENPHAFTGARILTITGGEIENGTLLVHRGKIAAVGSGIAIPPGAIVHDVSGRILMPGLVDTHSHVGQVAGADGSAPIQPEVRALDSVNVRHAGIQKAQAGGITTANVMPGSGHLLSGQTVYLKLRDGSTVEELAIRLPDGAIAGGMKMANGTNSRKDPPFPGSRGKSAALVREQYVKAREYCGKRNDPKIAADKRPARELAMEGLCEVLSGRRIVHHHTHRHDDIVTVLRLAEEFGFRVVLHHVSEGWKVAEEIARAKVPASIIQIDSPGGKLEAVDLIFETGATLEKAGVLLAYHTDDPITDSRLFLRSAAMGVRAGLSRQTALAALTLNGARMLDLDPRVGSLEAGKDADFIVLDGDPLSVYTKVLETWVEGEKVFDRSDPLDHLFAVGGYGAGHDSIANEELEMEGSR
ncbi:MAG: amidohydrolase family protein [Thermoanaerobaculia bacterium]|nr:amidohydrolase family protein [Thermoanaerobaculia bacterium]